MCMIFGERKYAMRVWLDPVRLAARGLTATDVVNALEEQNVEIPAGQLGQPPVRFQAGLPDSGARGGPAHQPRGVRQHHRQELRQRPGAAEGRGPRGGGRRRLQHRAQVRGPRRHGHRRAAALERQRARCGPPGQSRARTSSRRAFRRASNTPLPSTPRPPSASPSAKCCVTLAEAIVIVIAVIFLFLLDWRATIIPAVTIPVSLIGTFAFIKIFGFSINSLTLFGITLATGLVVDDAIVVIENVQRHIAMEHSDPHEATSRAMGEVTSAVIATSLVLIAVFVPVSFFPGTTGILYRQFSLTIAFSIAISAFNALTLSPALSALFLRGEEARPRQLDFLHIRPVSRAFAAFIHGADAFISWLASTYARVIHVALQLRYVLLLVFFAGLGATVWIYQHVPTGFIPQEDQGYFMVIVQAPPGSSLAYTTALADAAQAIIAQNPDVGGLFSIMGFSFCRQRVERRHDVCEHQIRRAAARQRPLDGRHREGHFAQTANADVYAQWRAGAAFEPPAVQGVGSFGGFQFMLQDQGGNTLSDLDRVAHQIVGASAAHKDLTDLFTTFSANDPQELVTIDREKAKAMGVSITQIATTLNVFMGSEYVNDFDYNNRTYRVLCAGRPAVPHEGQRPAQLLCALRFRPDGSAR